ncbi:hypothetical protein LH392_04415 [Corynebacterium uberis]|nr:hypothetical protein [Corynebacterium uberis]UDL76543.1 hypothetical protein LH393_04005 [Corynebacterium uberis]UDL81034.1 hypothetical protein LH392_04415 [Corynebacterium uberis]
MSRLSGSSFTLLVVGCLLIAMSDEPSSWRAVVGIGCLVLGLIAGILIFMKRRDAPAVISLSDEEKESLRAELNSKGLAHAVRQLRRDHPEATLIQAKETLSSL